VENKRASERCLIPYREGRGEGERGARLDRCTGPVGELCRLSRLKVGQRG